MTRLRIFVSAVVLLAASAAGAQTAPAAPASPVPPAPVAAPAPPVEPAAAAPAGPEPPAAAPAPEVAPAALTWDLEACLAQAMALRSERLQAAEAIVQAEAGVTSARAGYVPSATVSAGYQRVAGGASRAGAAGINDFSLGLSAHWTATDLAWVPTDIRSAEDLADAAGVSAEVTRRGIRLDVIVAYHALWGAERVGELTRETLAAAQLHREYALARREVGLAAAADVARAEVEIADATLSVTSADAATHTARAQLARTIGLPADTPLEIPDAEPQAGEVPTAPPSAPDRPEIAVLQHQAEAAQEDVHAASSGYWPTVTVSAGYGVEDTVFFPTRQSWSAGVAVSFPFLSWFTTQPAVDAAQAREAQLEAQIDTTREVVSFDVQSAWFALEAAQAELVAVGPLLTSAQENVRVAEGLYQEGTGSMIDLVDARNALLQGQITRVQALRDVAVAAARLRWAAGEEP